VILLLKKEVDIPTIILSMKYVILSGRNNLAKSHDTFGTASIKTEKLLTLEKNKWKAVFVLVVGIFFSFWQYRGLNSGLLHIHTC
jgi:hypothetical protein